MTVKELIGKLQGCNPEAVVFAFDGEWGEYHIEEVRETTQWLRVDRGEEALAGDIIERRSNADIQVGSEMIRYRAVVIR
jgi:hypothetical protein